VRIYTRDLRDVTGQFADVVRHARALPAPVILDGEILAYEEGKKLTFFDLQKRLGRKTEDDLFQTKSHVPVIYRAFDLLWLKGESLLRHPLVERRRLLEGLAFPEGFELTPITPVHSPAEIEAAFNAARLRHNEGLIAKDGASLYTPGRRGLAWLKLKKQLATLDVVVTGAELGHGKRSGVLSDYTFAVRDDETGALLNIGKAYSGVTDEEIEELTEHFINTTIATYGNYRQVRPEIVFEVAFDAVNPSTRHPSGLALRFPRIKAIRRDKTPAEIDTLSYAKSLVSQVEIK
jgi:DNA ligase-1